jgi:hypothetical protein
MRALKAPERSGPRGQYALPFLQAGADGTKWATRTTMGGHGR